MVADVPPQLRKCRRSFGMAAAEDHWDVWNFDYSVADPTDPVAAVAAPARAKVWTRLGSDSTMDLVVDDLMSACL